MNALIFDLEIKNAIPDKKTKGWKPLPGIEYCGGWGDHEGMGISVLCAYDMLTDRCRVFCDDNRHLFAELVAARNLCVGFNSVNFDNQVLEACWGINVPASKVYDVYRECRVAAGMKPTGFGGGLSLEALAEENFGLRKSGEGALAPIEWQRGNRGAVTDYCMHDVHMTWQLFQKAANGLGLKSPKGGVLNLRKPV